MEFRHVLFRLILSNMTKKKLFYHHLNILKWCDNLSLYLCLNETSAKMEKKYPFFLNKIYPTFSFTNDLPIQVHWADQETLSLSMSPLEKEVQVQFVFKEVKKEDIIANKLKTAYTNTHNSIRNLRII